MINSKSNKSVMVKRNKAERLYKNKKDQKIDLEEPREVHSPHILFINLLAKWSKLQGSMDRNPTTQKAKTSLWRRNPHRIRQAQKRKNQNEEKDEVVDEANQRKEDGI